MPAHATIDIDRCEGNMICQTNAPTVFQVQDDDLSHVLLEDIPTHLLPDVQRAVRLCPKQAITLLDD